MRFAEFLLERSLISDEQWLASLAQHWSESLTVAGRRRRIGATIVDNGFLPTDVVEAEARRYHHGLEVVEVVPRSEKTTLPIVPAQVSYQA